ncbi:hypothetical protein APR41_17715 [Salegentibacter salinarum]|uniref:LamG-like jellyroll fold domain-containing protein n=1 Tax=Salegentibacter salinarum TaxID=447422 RepID=A0A2N0TVL7_9FLAO|nr:LamG domain-containing protein [Salegentibacter salinarum]PKD18746.1 hypothetical protein APR41_17715 [Salegentibacter salinarum]SKB98506.1 Concanavalin A-like lectin/glucanases superfamily protein [Salegentibacter salinarum]
MKYIWIIFFLFGSLTNAQDLENGLIGHWPLDGDALDLSFDTNNGQIFGAVPVSNRFGQENKAMYFDGNSYISFGNVLKMGLGDYSISAWFKIQEGAQLGRESAIVAKSYSTGAIDRFAIGIADGNKVGVVLQNSKYIANELIGEEEWHLLTATFDRSSFLSIYLDNFKVKEVDISNSQNVDIDEPWPLHIGDYSGDGREFIGNIDDVRIYNRVLTAGEIEMIYTMDPEEDDCTGLITENDEGIGIGIENPGDYGLAVGGGIYTDAVKVMDVAMWPDYVFSETYDLLDLEDVASYIKEQGHLPGLPSAEEVLADGISLTQMDKANLKKLEELSLYLLDQHARMERLRAPKVEKASAITYSEGKERPYNFVLEQSGIEEGQGPLKTLSTDSLSTGTMYCDGDNVGIGIGQTSGYRLAVAGGILSEGVKVSSVSNWPDYVFSDDYAMLSLDDLRAYISTNKHLPGFPSAKTIAREGYSLSKMDKLLMEKVEELTLYVIDQESELESLSGELGVILPVADEEIASGKTVYKSYNVDIAPPLIAHTQKAAPHFEGGVSTSLKASPKALCDVIICNGEEVGIGTDPVEGYRLAGDGGILTDDIQVASVSNWPDYVFGADYKLRSLSSLSAYIEREGHLPGVPKAEFIEEEGYHLEAIDALLLEKIEELTLYLIGQERQLTFLESQSHRQ